jgi:molecular chaperone GrpE
MNKHKHDREKKGQGGEHPHGEHAHAEHTHAEHAPADNVEIPLAELDGIKKKAAERDEYYDKWLKVHAEYENTRKRMEKEKSEHLKYANEEIITRILPLVDNFDLAIMAIDKAEDKTAVIEGIKIILKEFHRVLDDNGVVKISAKGEQFDPNKHEAVLAVETEEYPEGTVIEEMRGGYMFNNRLLRPAQVKVAKSVSEG